MSLDSQEVDDPRIPRQSENEVGKKVSPRHRSPLLFQGDIPSNYFY